MNKSLKLNFDVGATRLVEAIPQPLFVIDHAHRVTYWNTACERLTGVSAAEMIGSDCSWMAFYKEERPTLADLVLGGIEQSGLERYYPGRYRASSVGDGSWEVEDYFPHLPEGGKWLVFNAAVLRDEQGHVVGAVETLRDVTAQKIAEQKIRDSELLLSEIVQGCPVPMFVIDAEHRVTHWNRACEAMTGSSVKEMIGSRQHWQPFYSEPRPVMADLVLDGSPELVSKYYLGKFQPSQLIKDAWEAKDHFPHFPGGGRWLYFTAAPLHGSGGQLIGAVETLQDISDQKRYEKMLELQARHDPLTGLPNRLVIEDRLELALRQAERDKRLLAVLFIDLDNFKPVNDRFGHVAGDVLLTELAARLRQAVRAVDTVARFGGDEFVVLLSAPETEESVRQVATRLIEMINQPVEAAGHSLQVGCSIGIALFPHDGEDVPTLLRHADAAMYRAKESGRNRFEFCSWTDTAA
jgi:diguanylate cyclase (GGDEF)-like protein/PAS domain S-box-containing protein